MYIQQSPDLTWTGLPYRITPKLDLSEGSHLGYAVQWFSFAVLLGVGYPFYVRSSTQRALARQASRVSLSH